MNNHKYTSQSQSYALPLHSSPQIRSNRIQQQLDDLHLVIQSSTPIKHKNTTINYVSPTRGSNFSQQETDYVIEIQQDDGSNIDVTLKLSREYQSPQRRSPQHHNLPYEGQNSYTENKNLGDRYNRPNKYRQNYREQKQYGDRKYQGMANNDIECNYSISYKDDEMRNNIKISYNDNSDKGSVNKSIKTTHVEQPKREQNPLYTEQSKNMKAQIHKGEHKPTAKQQCIHPNYHKNRSEDTSMELDISNSFSMIKEPNGQTYHNFQTKYKNTNVDTAPVSYTFGHEYNNNGQYTNINDYSQINMNRNNTAQKKEMKIQRSQKTFGSIAYNNGNIKSNPINKNTTINANVYMNESQSSQGNQELSKQKQKDTIMRNVDMDMDNDKQYWSQSKKPQEQFIPDYYSVNRQEDQQSPTFNRIQLFNKQRNSPKQSINSHNSRSLNMQDTFKKQKQPKISQNQQANLPNKTNYNTNTQFNNTYSQSDRNYYSSNSYKNQSNLNDQKNSVRGNLTQKDSDKHANQGASKSAISYFNKQVGRQIVSGKFGKKQKYESIKIQEQGRNPNIQESKNKNINPMSYSSYKQSQNKNQALKSPINNSQSGGKNLKSPHSIQIENNSHIKSPNVLEYQDEQPINVQYKLNAYNTPLYPNSQDTYRSSNQQIVKKYMRTYQDSNQHPQYQQQRQYETERQRIAPKAFEPEPEMTERRQNSNTGRQNNKNWPPSMKDIPSTNTRTNLPSKQSDRKQREGSNSKSKIIKLKTFEDKSNLKRISNSPIVVPMKRIPKLKTETNQPKAETKRVKISLNTTDLKGQKQRQRQLDVFAINKQKYLNKLRREQQSRSGSRPNRLKSNSTFSRNSRSQLSPECEQVTNRLHSSRINKQPCPKYLEYKQSMNRLRMRQTLGEYTFIRRYMSDDEIFEVIGELEQMGVPQKKWPVKLIDVVYNKLRKMKAI